ncbi:undecaprenyl/decaprenyl-phosphate alpha-N-acetylglucosaminyl 1-phosphate transferase [Pyxidicoccus fallax]|uniref:Undecaprenyl/decaprenyl-phosphate alpha-N-acetylglucosaminyl 1-phosphate transferase n=1 Tax=Pyxidicoccus fallax TaxID=394095 RepID=A0A848LYC9_9BACT|nr:MraY family glycosyltransferase [Pyxidicoccus fallax]NMO22629.1 undecaprenyl/decaprenyl-phosphate alpha-N-acetylglucosaminyl 1-phosphate transferase [Pyxidicoccus fallax]NPC84715.1 undecaprenyl/decaprenyl-phosphate alpha-N-acetylglucosaminyl 1-phosphate transferase [Pyxidicoccus fallax]
MITLFVAFLVSLMVALVLTLLVRNRAVAWGWLDQANSSRKVHVRPIPRLGGIGIVGGFFAPLCALFLVDSGVGYHFRSHKELVAGLFIGGAVIAALGLYDDLRGTGAKLKFAVQFAVALGLYAMGFRIEVIANPFGPELVLGALSLPFTVFWMVGVVNALNLIDGLDGLAGGVAFFGVATNFLLALSRGDMLLCLLMAALAGAILGFLVFNFNPASIFMGDTGSMFLGFVLAAVAIKTSTKSGTTVAMLVPVMALGLPIMDTLLAMVRRSMLGRPMFSADKEHIHHRVMSRLVLSHRATVLVLYGLCGLFTLTALGLNFANSAQSAMLLCGMGVVIVVMMRKLGYLDLRRAADVQQVRQRNIRLRSLVKDVTRAVRSAPSLQDVWNALRPLAEALELSRQELRFRRESGGLTEGIVFETQRPAGSAVPFEVSIDVKDDDDVLGSLRLVWRDGRTAINRDEELALEVVADAVAERAARLHAHEDVEPGRILALRR